MQKLNCDVLIIGGGIVGLSLARGLELQGISYLLVDESIQSPKKGMRPLALSKTSVAILKYLQVWDDIKDKVTPIEKIHVSAEGQWGHLELDEASLEHLGVVVNLNELHAILLQKFKNPEVLLYARFTAYNKLTQTVSITKDQTTLEISAKLVIAADGALSSVRIACGLPVELQPEQEALISRLSLKHPHQGKAFERFTKLGPLALLPIHTHDMAIVWSLSQEKVRHLKENHFFEFAAMIAHQLSYRMGEILEVGPVRTYPLRQIFMPVQTFQNILFLGNAAHTLHPVAGQGFNLSLRDVVTFLDILKKYGLSKELIPIYLLKRRDDQRFTQYLTQFLATGFNHLPGILQAAGLCALSHHPRLKLLFSHYAQGLGYALPVEIYQFLESSDE
jgi:2-octaprenyl-6-methoxyphenol hydroxylase